MVASEAAPYVKTGGLADVVGTLPGALRGQGDEVAVVLPRYRSISTRGMSRVQDQLRFPLGGGYYTADLYRSGGSGTAFYFVDCPALYDRPGLYTEEGEDYPDNHIRFGLLARAALEVARRIFRPQVLHCHDWQASLTPVYQRRYFDGDPTFYGMRSLLTIHNLGYQGLFEPGVLPELGLETALFTGGELEFYGRVNLLKGGIVLSDAISTVSRGYAREIQTAEFGFGLDGLLRSRAGVLHGILNGVDYREWNPETDPHIACHYSAEDLSGKLECKLDLLEQFGLPAEHAGRPLIGIVGRFTRQKGFDLIAQIAGELANEDMALVALGTGEPEYEEMFRGLAGSYPGRIAVRVAYDNVLAHKIEAGADLFLMPSHYEPCGLNQIYSMRYGTLPVVRATGGLDDTVEEGTGFKFWQYSGEALLGAIRHALGVFQDRDRWEGMMRQAMGKDFSWGASAAEYSALYRRLAGGA